MKLFISYRRTDTQDLCDRLYHSLASEFGKENVFKDVVAIHVASDWQKQIRKNLRGCDLLLVLIGKTWLTCSSENGTRRLDAPDDWVRFEIETALQWDIPIVPLIASDVKTPTEDQLPKSLAGLTKFQSRPLRSDPEYSGDVSNLITELRKVLPPPINYRGYIATALIGLLALGGLWAVLKPTPGKTPVREIPGETSLDDTDAKTPVESVQSKLERLNRDVDESQKKSNDDIDAAFTRPQVISEAMLFESAATSILSQSQLQDATALFREASDQRKTAAHARHDAYAHLLEIVDGLSPIVGSTSKANVKLAEIRKEIETEAKKFGETEINSGKFDLRIIDWLISYRQQYFDNAKKLDAQFRNRIKEVIEEQFHQK